MKSIKPGRGPSAMNFMGSVFAVIFGISWTIMTASIGAPFFFPIFGILFIIMGIVQAIYHYNNTTGKNRFSTFDITENGEEMDPFNQRFGNASEQLKNMTESDDNVEYCPYCGTKVDDEFEFCSKCGKKLP